MKNSFCGALLFSGVFLLAGSVIDACGMRGSEALKVFPKVAWGDEADHIDVSDPNAVIAVSKRANPELYQKLRENVLFSAGPDCGADWPETYIRLKSINDLKCDGASLLDGVHDGSYIVFDDSGDEDFHGFGYCEVTDSDYVKFLDYSPGNEEDERKAYEDLISSATRFPDGSLHVSVNNFKKMIKDLNRHYTEDSMLYKCTSDFVKPGNCIKHRSDTIYIDE